MPVYSIVIEEIVNELLLGVFESVEISLMRVLDSISYPLVPSLCNIDHVRLKSRAQIQFFERSVNRGSDAD